jgi:hypothetical protein
MLPVSNAEKTSNPVLIAGSDCGSQNLASLAKTLISSS